MFCNLHFYIYVHSYPTALINWVISQRHILHRAAEGTLIKHIFSCLMCKLIQRIGAV